MKLRKLSQRLGVRYFWVDRLCIVQRNDADKELEIPRMREYYTGASGCVVLCGPGVQTFECLPQHSGAILSAYQQVQQNSAALKSLFSCKWATRVWTLQEALLSRQVVYAIEDQLVDGDYISELVSFVETFSERYTGDPTDPEWFRRQDGENGTEIFSILRTVFGGEQQYQELDSAGEILMPFEQALTMITDRHASRDEDHIYGLLGLCDRGDSINVEYNISWRTMLEKLRRAGMITERQLASSTINDLPGLSWLPKCDSGYGPFKNLERISAFVRGRELSWSEEGATVFGAVFEWKNYKCKEWDILNVHGMTCFLVYGTIEFPDTPGLVIQVGGTSSVKFTEERMRGTHVILCRDVIDTTREVVAIKVGGDIETGHVYKVDGYVLELHEWVMGDPSMLDGRQWIVGSVPGDGTHQQTLYTAR
ncbi:hypothetical protein KVR01_010664 [Diaporthe batatas]|uniref:uncharacterized protein n=1 Tax=Diaporthe batatas TaxID=748121 RepID=UPI001D03B81B|nr:uncharacterized protein KVR01_010664 [Diaporthe batatas]KAG8160027.1 hypothetical protein KVR01_010664 [Diaporthe batatas]